MRYLGSVALLLWATVACSGSSDEAADDGPGPTPGFGGSGGGPGGNPPESLEDFGYATELESTLDPLAAAPAGPNVSTACGTLDITSVETIQVHPSPARSFASAARSREMIGGKQAPISASLRTEDHLSYYRVGANPNTPPDSLVPSVALRQLQIVGQLVPRRYQLFVGLSAGPISVRPPVALTVLVDTTPSMAGEPLERAKKSLRALADSLVANDHLAVLTTDLQVLFDQALVDPAADTVDLEQKLQIGEDQALRIPVETALDKASSLLGGQHWDRVVVISDGQGDPDTLPFDKISEKVSAGIRLNTVGVGGSYVTGDALLYRASSAGRGSYVYVDSLDEPDKMLKARFDEIFGVLFDSVQVKLALPWFLQLVVSASTTGPPQTDANPRAIAPGGTLSFLFDVESCADVAMEKYGASFQLGVNVAYVKPADGGVAWLDASLKTIDATKIAAPGLDELLATRAYVAALRAPTKDRFADAVGLLTPLKQPGNAFDEMWNLLDAYPKKP